MDNAIIDNLYLVEDLYNAACRVVGSAEAIHPHGEHVPGEHVLALKVARDALYPFVVDFCDCDTPVIVLTSGRGFTIADNVPYCEACLKAIKPG